MNITLYTNNSETNKIGKNLTQLATLTGSLRESSFMLNPVIRVTGISAADVAKCNYMYIPDFGRYYFVRDIGSIRTGLWELSAHVDVLETYAAQIKQQSAVISRQENEWNLYLNDDVFKVTSIPKVITKTFPSGFDSLSWVLAIAGG